jgi:hypothetical protein
MLVRDTGIESVTACQTRGRFRLICCLQTFVVTWTPCTDSCRAGAVTQCRARVPIGQVYRPNDRGIVGVEPFSSHSLGFFSVHTPLDVGRGLTVPPMLQRACRCAGGSKFSPGPISISRRAVQQLPWKGMVKPAWLACRRLPRRATSHLRVIRSDTRGCRPRHAR